ncbi:MAG: DUF3450 family protein [Verrucomicrobiae bacterium]|nr:DUF3450 family protein [Verrucomicrobiae bacterium]
MLRNSILSLALLLPATTGRATGSPTEDLRDSVSRWVDTMSRIQTEENDWKRDKEVLDDYREGLVEEIEDLEDRIAEAETRKQGADKETTDRTTDRDRYLAARKELAEGVIRLERQMHGSLPLFPPALRSEPKVAEAIEKLEADVKLAGEDKEKDLSKRLLNLITLTSEAEKFQQTVHIRPELHKDKSGREFNMQVIYFGMAMAYAVNEDGSLAFTGRPGSEGWLFEEKPELATEIRNLISAASGDSDAVFVQLPYAKP